MTENIIADIQCRLQILNQRIAALPPLKQNFSLIAVSKFQAFEKIFAAYQLGIRHFGENYLQEALLKMKEANEKNLKVTWHFIGPIQSNKTRAIAENFHWAHTLERFKIAERLNAQRPTTLPPLNVCVEVNIGKEEKKSGVLPENAQDLCLALLNFPRLSLRGLMAIPPATKNKNEQRFYAQTLRTIFEKIKKELPPSAQKDFTVLSIGMSDDLESALLEGATHIRIGSALFGERFKAPFSKI